MTTAAERSWPMRLCAALGLALALAGAQARPFGEMVGLQVKFAQGQPPQGLEDLKDLGVRWVRDHVAWSTIEPVPGVYRDFPEDFRNRLEFYRRHAIRLVFVLGLTNKQAYPPTPQQPHRHADAQAFGKHAAAVARMLKAAGVEFVLEVWNEPHGKGSELLDLYGGNWNGAPPSPWLDRYVEIVRETVLRVKQVDPALRVLVDDDMWVLHYWFLEAGLPKEIDGFAVHPYTVDAPERTAVGPDTEWTRPFTVVDADRSFGSAVRRLLERGRLKLGRDLKVWVTEWGWALGEPRADGQPVSEADVAAWLARAFVLAAAADVEVLCWFSAQDTVDGPMGLVSNTGRKRLAYGALKTIVDQLGPFEYGHALHGLGAGATGLQAHVFRGRYHHKLVVWSADERERRIRVDDSLRLEAAVDAQGRRVPMDLRAGDGAELMVGSAPVYLTVRNLPGPRAVAAVAVQAVGP